MKRPIPEGVKPPEGCVILPEIFVLPPCEFFVGWRIELHEFSPNPKWVGPKKWYGMDQNNDCRYAADADSEVARLNRDPLMDSVFGKDNCKGDKALGTECGSCERCKSYGWTQEDPRDGAIRELVDALKRITNRETGSMWSHDEIEMFDIADSALDLAKEKGFE